MSDVSLIFELPQVHFKIIKNNKKYKNIIKKNLGHKNTFTLFIHSPITRASHGYDGSTNKWKAQIDKAIEVSGYSTLINEQPNKMRRFDMMYAKLISGSNSVF